VYRYEESMLYPNASILNSALVDYVKEHTRRGKDMSGISASDRPWNDPGPRPGHEAEELAKHASKPVLSAIVLDFTTVSHIDTTGVQALVDARTEVERWSDKEVEFHFANISSPWIRRALVAGGFGSSSSSSGRRPTEIAPVVPYHDVNNDELTQHPVSPVDDIEAVMKRPLSKSSDSSAAQGEATVTDETPFFHQDLASAVNAAERSTSNNAKSRKVDEYDYGQK